MVPWPCSGAWGGGQEEGKVEPCRLYPGRCPQTSHLHGLSSGAGLSRESTTSNPAAPLGGAGESGCETRLAASHDHCGTCKLPEPPPRPHRDRRPRQWRVWPGRGPCERWCWPGGSPPWRWPCWSRKRDVLMKGSIPMPNKTAPARQASDPLLHMLLLSSAVEEAGQSGRPEAHVLLPPGRSRRQQCPVARNSRAWRR